MLEQTDTSVYVANSSTEAGALLTEDAISQDECSIPVVQVDSSSSVREANEL